MRSKRHISLAVEKCLKRYTLEVAIWVTLGAGALSVFLPEYLHQAASLFYSFILFVLMTIFVLI